MPLPRGRTEEIRFAAWEVVVGAHRTVLGLGKREGEDSPNLPPLPEE